jgi:hypothetical protein
MDLKSLGLPEHIFDPLGSFFHVFFKKIRILSVSHLIPILRMMSDSRRSSSLADGSSRRKILFQSQVETMVVVV